MGRTPRGAGRGRCAPQRARLWIRQRGFSRSRCSRSRRPRRKAGSTRTIGRAHCRRAVAGWTRRTGRVGTANSTRDATLPGDSRQHRNRVIARDTERCRETGDLVENDAVDRHPAPDSASACGVSRHQDRAATQAGVHSDAESRRWARYPGCPCVRVDIDRGAPGAFAARRVRRNDHLAVVVDANAQPP
jgi:hypothetical protein